MKQILLLLPLIAASIQAQHTAPPPASERAMVVVDEERVRRREPPPHGAIGMSDAYRTSDAAPGRTMEFRRRVLHRNAAIGPHPIAHDGVY